MVAVGMHSKAWRRKNDGVLECVRWFLRNEKSALRRIGGEGIRGRVGTKIEPARRQVDWV